jgi:hypothetical protein
MTDFAELPSNLRQIYDLACNTSDGLVLETFEDGAPGTITRARVEKSPVIWRRVSHACATLRRCDHEDIAIDLDTELAKARAPARISAAVSRLIADGNATDAADAADAALMLLAEIYGV